MDPRELPKDDEQREALRTCLLTELANERGDASDEDVDLARDRALRILGRHAMSALPDVANERGLDSADIRAITRDDQRLNELLAVLQDKRRPGFERQPRTRPHPGNHDDEHPEALLVMAEYAVGDPVWNRSPGHGGPVDLADLSITEKLQRSLRLWNETYERVPLTGWGSEQAQAAWVQEGLELAHRLQTELPDIDILYWHADDERPLRETRGH
jgi:hypothetical protein